MHLNHQNGKAKTETVFVLKPTSIFYTRYNTSPCPERLQQTLSTAAARYAGLRPTYTIFTAKLLYLLSILTEQDTITRSEELNSCDLNLANIPLRWYVTQG